MLTKSITFDGAGQSLSLPSASLANFYRIQVVGAGVMTLQFQDSLDDGVTFGTIRLRNENAGTDSTDMTVAGIYVLLDTMMARAPRIAVSAYTSGSFQVFVTWYPAAIAASVTLPRVNTLFTGISQVLTIPASDESQNFTLQIVGGGVMTLQLQDSLDGGLTFVPTRVKSLRTGTTVNDLTAADLYCHSFQNGFVMPRLVVTAFTSGQLAAYVLMGGRVFA